MALNFDFARHNARISPDRVVVRDLARGIDLTAAMFDREVDRHASWLSARLGDPLGERIAYIGRNRFEMLVLQLACVRAGAIFVPLNWRLSALEIAGLLADCEPALIVTEAGFADLVPGERQSDHVDLDRITLALPEPAAGLPAPEGSRVITILYSSGTTGRPKGVCVTLENGLAAAFGLARDVGIGGGSALLLDMPMFHTAGLFGAAWSALLQGGQIAISQGFDPAVTLARLCDPELAITHYFSVPQMAQRLRAEAGARTMELRKLTAFIIGGGPNPVSHHQAWQADGVAMVNAWGMSEIGSGSMTSLATARAATPPRGAVGQPHIGVELAILGPAGEVLGPGETGEVAARGPTVMAGYWRAPELMEAAFSNGWFRTGDCGYRDEDGALFLTDRIKDMYISGGENVYPAEIESVLAALPGLAASAVIGVPDERWGEVGCVYAVPAAGAQVSAEDILAHCSAHLARFKVPHHVRLVEAIAMTGSGKPLKQELRRLWSARGQAQDAGMTETAR